MKELKGTGARWAGVTVRETRARSLDVRAQNVGMGAGKHSSCRIACGREIKNLEFCKVRKKREQKICGQKS